MQIHHVDRAIIVVCCPLHTGDENGSKKILSPE